MDLVHFELERTHLSMTNLVQAAIRPIGMNFVDIRRYITLKADKIGTRFRIQDNSASQETSTS